MGSPLGPALANIFMIELEIAMIPSLGNYLRNWKWFVDDTFTFVLPDKIEYIVNHLWDGRRECTSISWCNGT